MSIRKVLLTISVLNAVLLGIVISFSEKNIVATHFGLAGNADSWGSKWTYLLFGLIPLVLEFVYLYYRKYSEKKPELQKNKNIEEKTIPIIILLFIAMGWIFTSVALFGEGDLNNSIYLITIIFGILMMYISNFYGKLSQNRRFGIKVPWTLKDETVWNKTHRLGGYLGVVGGMILVFSGVFGMALSNYYITGYGFIASMFFIVIIPIIYSAFLYGKLHPRNKI
ncbi:MAG: SdpI family protein [Flexilinea sp.]